MLPKDRLYNVMFPIWMLLLFPQLWIITLPLNFLVDGAVLWFTLGALGIVQARRRKLCKRAIFLVWTLGFIADFIGAFFMFVWNIVDFEDVSFGNAIMYNPFQRVDSLLWVTFCVVLTGFIIYLFNRYIALRNLPLEDGILQRLSLSLAVFTAPYLFYLPTAWFW